MAVRVDPTRMTMRTPRGGSAELLRQHLLTALERASRPMTTAQLRDDMHEHFGSPVVIESVYRNLTVLERRGDVERCKMPGRDAHWSRVVDQSASAI